MKKIFHSFLVPATVAIALMSCSQTQSQNGLSLDELSACFDCPPQQFGPYVWWHWLGTNFTLEGIDKDLRAMKESGIAGATIFNVTSDVHEPLHGILNSPWPDHTYRGEAYWEALEHAAETALELDLKLGIHNAPGYVTTGGPWIDERRGMQKLVHSETAVTGGKSISISLSKPELPLDRGWGAHAHATLYTDIAVMAVPSGPDTDPKAVLDISRNMDEEGRLDWDAPEGDWTIVRIGQSPSMSSPHPMPEDLIGKSLEVDKMNAEASAYHWDNVLDPLKEHLGPYIGKSFTHVLIDSYEADYQRWTYGFREEFVKEFGYDPMPFFALSLIGKQGDKNEAFNVDLQKIVNRLYFENGWNIARDKIHDAGLQFYWEPYEGPFDVSTGAALADVPMGEFWLDTDGVINPEIVEAARINHKNIVGAEAFTGKAHDSKYTEDPALLKPLTDAAFSCGVNLLFFHHWAHQALDDCYKPGLSMGTWGTHFGRNQTWFEPGKAYIRYITRCQMLLRQGQLQTIGENCIRRTTDDAEIFFIANPDTISVTRRVSCDCINSKPELWDACSGKIYDASPISEKKGNEITVSVALKPAESMFVIFAKRHPVYSEPLFIPQQSRTETVEGTWDVAFKPATAEAEFEIKDFNLSDFSTSDDERISFFAGTATYTKCLDFSDCQDALNSARVLLDLGEMNDIATLRVNGKDAGVLWNPPYVGDITDFIQPGSNLIEIDVAVNWTNRLIGDERFEADLDWHSKSDEEWALTSFPDWLVNGSERPSAKRKSFANYTYFTSSSQLVKAGLTGPVKVIFEE